MNASRHPFTEVDEQQNKTTYGFLACSPTTGISVPIIFRQGRWCAHPHAPRSRITHLCKMQSRCSNRSVSGQTRTYRPTRQTLSDSGGWHRPHQFGDELLRQSRVSKRRLSDDASWKISASNCLSRRGCKPLPRRRTAGHNHYLAFAMFLPTLSFCEYFSGQPSF